MFIVLSSSVRHPREILSLLTFHAIILRGDDLSRTVALQRRVGPHLAHLCARLGLVFADCMFAAINDGDAVSEEMHLGLIEPAAMRAVCAPLIPQFIGFREACTGR